MNDRSFTGRVLIPGARSGPALVSRAGVNMLASYQRALITRSRKAVCADQNNPDLYGKPMAGRIICLPQTIGSTSGGLVIQTAANMGMAPAALLFSERIDSLAAAGIILADVWSGHPIVTIDCLGTEFLEAVRQGQRVDIAENGTVTLRG
ncbi:MAG TPA: DUF126 domain-containing protein [Spirochaetota bacterium]|nr:DUF126 domain-containing protein [Spirochaetota bacterium]HNT11887.1 DUF126 domain-containing protein [Spirochaetota bacterium]